MLWPPLVPVTHPAPNPPNVVGQVSALTEFTVPVGNCAEALKQQRKQKNRPIQTARHKRVCIKIPSTQISHSYRATRSQCNATANQNVEINWGKPEQLGGRPAPRDEKAKCISTFFRNKIICILTESRRSVNCFWIVAESCNPKQNPKMIFCIGNFLLLMSA